MADNVIWVRGLTHIASYDMPIIVANLIPFQASASRMDEYNRFGDIGDIGDMVLKSENL